MNVFEFQDYKTLLEMRRNDEIPENVDKSADDKTSKLESAINDVHNLTIEMEKAKLLRDFAKEEFLMEKQRAEKFGRQLAKTLGCKTDQVNKNTESC